MSLSFGLSILHTQKFSTSELQNLIHNLASSDVGKPEQSEGKAYLLTKGDSQMAEGIVDAFKGNSGNWFTHGFLKNVAPQKGSTSFHYHGTKLESFIGQLREGKVNEKSIQGLKEFMASTCGVSVIFGLILAANTLQQLSDTQNKNIDTINNSENIEKLFGYVLNEISSAQNKEDSFVGWCMVAFAGAATYFWFLPVIQALAAK